MVEQDLVEIRIRADERKLRCFPVEDDLVCVRTKLYAAPEEFFEFRRPARASMNKANDGRLQTAACQSPTHADKRGHQQFHLLPIGLSGNAKVAQGNGEISGLEAVQNDACIASVRPMVWTARGIG